MFKRTWGSIWGNKDAMKARDDLTAKMTPAQIAETQRMAREWKRRSKEATRPRGWDCRIGKAQKFFCEANLP